jgi:hypothetical protein
MEKQPAPEWNWLFSLRLNFVTRRKNREFSPILLHLVVNALAALG